MKRQQLIEDIAFIKSVIHSSICYTNLSGIGAIISGIVALFGVLISWYILPESNGRHILQISFPLVMVWIIVFVVSVISQLYFIVRKARKNGEPAWSRLARLIVYALSPALLIGAFATIFLVVHHQFIYIPAVWMLMYGLGVWSAGLFSIPEPRWLGASFMITGMLTLFFFTNDGLMMLAISFGGYHVIYGVKLIVRYGG